MSTRPDDVLRVLHEFITRIDQFDPDAPALGDLELGWRGATARVPIRPPVARALAEALIAYHDPRDHGSCAHCRTGQLDENFVCRSCGIVNGVFGRTLAGFLTPEQSELGGSRPAIEGPSAAHDQ